MCGLTVLEEPLSCLTLGCDFWHRLLIVWSSLLCGPQSLKRIDFALGIFCVQ